MKTREKKKVKNPNCTKRRMEIVGLVFIATSFFLWAAYFGFSTGSLGSFLVKVLRYSFGLGAPLAPCAFLVLGFGLCVKNENWLLTTRALSVLLFVFCVLGLLHHIFVPVGEELTPEYLPEGGGLIGGCLVSILRKVVGSVGTLILLIVGIIFSFVLTGKVSLSSSAAKAGQGLHAFELPGFLRRKKDDGAYEDEEDDYEQAESNEARFASLYGDGYSGNESESKSDSVVSSNTNSLDVYGNDEFSAFNDGLQKPSVFKRILDFVHEEQSLDTGNEFTEPLEAFGSAPKSSPVHSQENVVLRPVSVEKPEFCSPKPEVPGDLLDNKTDASGTTVPVSPEENNREGEQPAAPEAVSRPAAPASDKKIPIKNFNNEAEAGKGSVQPAAALPSAIRAAGAASSSGTSLTASSADNKPVLKTSYQLPPLALLTNPVKSHDKSYQEDVIKQCSILEQTLADFKVHAKVVAVTRGPSVTRFELEPAPGVKVSSVVNLSDDIALRLAAPGVRIEAPIPGKAAIGIEAPNIKNETVFFKEVVDCAEVREAKSKLCVGLGRSISGKVITADLGKMPHLLVAGSTGSGKSVCINTLIAGLLYKDRPEEVKFILIDPKVVELSNYNGIPHLLVPVVTDAKKAASALHWAVMEMERRYQAFAVNHVRDIASYNAQSEAKMPFIVIVIDELSDLMMVAKADVEEAILRLAQKARAAGIHLVIATQRPSVDVITGIVKANIPSRIAFAVSSQIDSRTILDMGGAENLLGKGDMLFNPIGMNKPVRVQGAFVSDEEINKIVNFIKDQAVPIEYTHEVTEQKLSSDKGNGEEADGTNDLMSDELFEEAVRLVMDLGQASSSMLQRRFRIGYTRAARLVDCMEELGIVGPAVGSKPRELIMTRPEIETKFFKNEEG